MANLREIKNRLKSTKNTAKVTKAMEMVSAAKSKTASKEALSIAEYCNKINEIVVKLGASNIIRNVDNKKIGVVTVGPSKGFVGQLKNVMTNKLTIFVNQKSEFEIEGIGVNKYGAKINLTSGIKTKYSFEDGKNMASILTLIKDKYDSGVYGELYVIYSKFINLLKSEAVVEKLLPIENNIKNVFDDSFLYEPNQMDVLNNLQEKLLEAKLMSAIINSNASEHAARMMTMKNATDNANDLAINLTKSLNRERQNKITQQIIEVASGGKNYEN